MRTTALLALAALFATAPRAQDKPEQATTQRPKIGLVLSGGGARGLAHVGVLEVLEELRIPVDYVSGTSMGALVGGLYASGWSPAELRQLVESLDWNRVFSDIPERGDLMFRRKRDESDYWIKLQFGWKDGGLTLPPGLMLGQNVATLLEHTTIHTYRIEHFDQLKIPFRCVATDLDGGEAVVFEDGHLSDAMRASMSIPGVFAPARIDGRQLVDGGIVDNLPVDVAREMGAEVIIAVDVGTPLESVEELKSLLSVTNQVIGIMMQQNVDRSKDAIEDRDVLMTVPLGDITAMDFAAFAPAIEAGRGAAASVSPRLLEWSVSETDWDAWVEHHRREEELPTIDAVRIENNSKLGEDVIRERLKIQTGETIDLDVVEGGIEELSGMKLFEMIRYQVNVIDDTEREGEKVTELVGLVDERSWGPHYIDFGLGIQGDFQGENDMNFRVRHTWNPVNSRAGEWRNELQIGRRSRFYTEFYQPLDRSLSWFVVPRLEFRHDRNNVILGDSPSFQAESQWGDARLDVGRVLGNWGEIRLGYLWARGSFEIELGPLLPDEKIQFTEAGLEARFTADTLDNLAFPRSGVYAELSVGYGDENMGADDLLTRLYAEFTKPLSFGDSTITTRIRLGSALGHGTGPIGVFRLGGLLNLSGFAQDELLGNYMAYGALIFYHRLQRPATRFSSSVYVGASLEAGATWLDEDDVSASDLIPAGSAFLGVDTALGPIYLGFGAADGDRYSGYLYVGGPF